MLDMSQINITKKWDLFSCSGGIYAISQYILPLPEISDKIAAAYGLINYLNPIWRRYFTMKFEIDFAKFE